jgi:hypothetical protein
MDSKTILHTSPPTNVIKSDFKGSMQARIWSPKSWTARPSEAYQEGNSFETTVSLSDAYKDPWDGGNAGFEPLNTA